MSAVAGSFAILIGLAIAIGYAIVGDMPPFVFYLPTGLVGLVLLRERMVDGPTGTNADRSSLGG